MKFSVVIPVFNGESVIERAIESVAEQSFRDFELIVVNDGSTDRTEATVNSVCSNYPLLIWKQVITSNQGRSHARNLGIKKARGDFICFLDADDTFIQNHLVEFHEATKLFPRISCFFADSNVKTTGAAWNKYTSFLDRLLARGEFYELRNNYVIFSKLLPHFLVEGSLIPMCSTAIKKQALITIGFFDESYSSSEDFDLWFRLSLKYRFVAIKKSLSTVYHHDNNTSHPSQKSINISKQLQVTRGLIAKSQDFEDPELTLRLVNKESTLFGELLYHTSCQSFEMLWYLVKSNKSLVSKHKLRTLKSLARALLKRT